MVDSHCHLTDTAFDPDRDAVVSRARAAGVAGIVVVADTLDSSAAALALAERSPGVVATAGVHPHHASGFTAAVGAELARYLRRSEVVALGETGLDYHYERSPRTAQRAAFEWHLQAAARSARPVVVHSRDADADTAAMLTAAPTGVTGVLHCFSAGREVLAAGLEKGFYVSFSGMITFASWSARWAVEAVPDDRLLVETDAPYLAPVPHRGRRNEPSYLPAIVARLAELRSTTPERIAELTARNAGRLFGLASPTSTRP